jgi:Amt family ammonium transporter
MTTDTWLPALLGYLIPVGFFLLAWGGMAPRRAHRAANLGMVALSIAALGYFAVGFAFHLGGARLVSEIAGSDLTGLEGLNRLIGHQEEMASGGGINWGFLGFAGFLLTGGADTPQARGLFVTYLPLVATAVLVPMLSLEGRARSWQVALLGLLVATIIFPLAACWAWGGGWLAAMGLTLSRGHGLVDYAGSGVVYLLGGMVAFGGLVAVGRRPRQGGPAVMPPAHFPLLASVGVMLLALGSMGWALSVPFHVAGAHIDPARVAVNGVMAAGGATLTSLAYCWLVLGHGDPLMVARGLAAGLVAISAGAPFIPPWAALVIGILAGLALPLMVYLIDHLLRLDDATAAVATTALSGLIGLLAVAFFADGLWGQWWNGVSDTYRQVAGQGVTGFLPAAGFPGDGPGQLVAQLTGLGVLAGLGFVGGWVPVKLTDLLLRLSDEIRVGAEAPRDRTTPLETPDSGTAIATEAGAREGDQSEGASDERSSAAGPTDGE